MIDRDSQIAVFQEATNVSRETIERLKIYHSHLEKWNPVINLVGWSTISDIWQRHFLDSAQLWKLKPLEARSWIDLGSGAGFPGLIIATLAVEDEPEITVELVESDARKAAFLLSTSHAMGLSVTVHTKRVEDVKAKAVDVISARALADLSKLFEYSKPYLSKNTVLLFPKGKKHQIELTEARKYWTFKHQKTPSITDPDGVILKIEGLGRV